MCLLHNFALVAFGFSVTFVHKKHLAESKAELLQRAALGFPVTFAHKKHLAESKAELFNAFRASSHENPLRMR